MYSQGEIEEAVAAGALDASQAASLRDFVAARNKTPTSDEEYVRVYRGYNDLFATYACFFGLVAAGWLGTLIPLGARGSDFGPIPYLPFMAPLLVAGAAWGLAEIFTSRLRTALPSILLAFSFALGVVLTLIFILAPVARDPIGGSILMALCCAAAAAATWGYWLRFGATIAPALSVGLGVLAMVGMLLGLLATSPAANDVMNVVLLICGIGVFTYAMWHDGGDPWRVSDRNEIGFWMHALAAALLIYPSMHFLGISDGIATVGGSIAAIVLFIVLALLALAVNRKMYVATGLSPLMIALNRLINGENNLYSPGYNEYDPYGGGFGGAYGGSPYGAPPAPYSGGMAGSPMSPDIINGTFATMLIISVIMLALAIWWAPLRRIVSGIMPDSVRERAPLTQAAVEDVPPPPIAPPPPQPPAE